MTLSDDGPRCGAVKQVDPGSTLLGPELGPRLNQPDTGVRCRLSEGHPGPHRGLVQPFPGFADQDVVWQEDA